MDALMEFGDFRWWEREDCFAHGQCRAYVPDLEAAKAELVRLFPADICRRVAARHWVVRGLFQGDGWDDDVDAVLQLGADLTMCARWRRKRRLVAQLQDPVGYEPARFEVGVWAGLRRAGIEPEVEPSRDRSYPRADFRFLDSGVRAALELKSKADALRLRNLADLEDALIMASVARTRDAPSADIRFHPTAELLVAIEDNDLDFHAHVDQHIFPRLRDAFRTAAQRGRVEIENAGLLTVEPIAEQPSSERGGPAGSLHVAGNDTWTIEDAAHRARSAIHEAQAQLAATEADLLVALVWGSYNSLPASTVVDYLASTLRAEEVAPIDWVGIVNCHRTSTRHAGWVTELALLPVTEKARACGPMRWPQAVVDWSLLHSLPSARCVYLADPARRGTAKI